MNIAFYAPLKSPGDPVPSGDRQIARNIMTALTTADIAVDLASTLRTYEGKGDHAQQTALETQAGNEALKLISAYGSGERARPDAWFTYHSYHKAPDWIGPAVANSLGIPYCLAEASVSPRQAAGPWRDGHAQACHAVSVADLIVGMNPRDQECVASLMKSDAKYASLPPFLDTDALRNRSDNASNACRQEIATRHNIDDSQPWLLAVGMMRKGDKFQSYKRLAEALDQRTDEPWQLLCVGDGVARSEIQDLFQRHAERVSWLGARPPGALPDFYTSADLLVWPAVNEALGMTFLEAAACGLTCVAGYTDGVASIVIDNTTGLIAPAEDITAFAEHISSLLESPDRRREMGQAARRHAEHKHSLTSAAQALKQHLREAVNRHARSTPS